MGGLNGYSRAEVMADYAATGSMQATAARLGASYYAVRQALKGATPTQSYIGLRRRLARALGVGPEATDARMLEMVEEMSHATTMREVRDARHRSLDSWRPPNDRRGEILCYPVSFVEGRWRKCEPSKAQAVLVSGADTCLPVLTPAEAVPIVGLVLSGRPVSDAQAHEWGLSVRWYAERVAAAAKGGA